MNNNTGTTTDHDSGAEQHMDGMVDSQEGSGRKRSVGFDMGKNEIREFKVESFDFQEANKKMKADSFRSDDETEPESEEDEEMSDTHDSSIGTTQESGPPRGDSPYPDAAAEDDEEAEAEEEANEPSMEEGQEEEPQESEEDRKWDEFLEDKRTRNAVDSIDGLETFLKSQKKWENAAETLGNKTQGFVDEMEKLQDNVCNKIIRSIFTKRKGELHDLSESCRTLLIQNEKRRGKLLSTLKKADKAWKLRHRSLVDQTWDQVDTEQQEEAEAEDVEESEENEQDLLERCLNDPKTERARIAQLYFDAQQRMETAEQRFLQALESTHEEWGKQIASIADMVVSLYEEQAHDIHNADDYIRGSMVANYDRRVEYHKTLEEAQQAKNAFFSSLLHKVTNQQGSNGKAAGK